MPTNYPASSSTKYLLYHYYKALDQVQELGLIPVRLFRVLYPLWRVRVEAWQRVSTDFDEIEWSLERAVQQAGLASVQDLADFFGLELAFAQRLVHFSRLVGHLSGDDAHLVLTGLGAASVRDRARYEDQKTSTELYFDALGCRLLTPEHCKIPILESLPAVGTTAFQAFYHFEHSWDEAALAEALKSGQAQAFNLPAEISAAQLLNREPVYMPVYLVEARENKPASPLRLLVFSQVRGLRDSEMEAAVNRDPLVYRALKAKTDSRAESLRRYFEQGGLKKDAWYLNENGTWGAQVMVDGQVFLSDADEDESGRLTLRSVGRYALIYDWCIWVMCDDAKVRKQAASEQLLEWLQNANANPARAEISKKFASLSGRLNIALLSAQELLVLARRAGYTRAAARLEEMEEA